MEELPLISDEQDAIVKNIADGYNVQVSAVAGSGKTTTALYIAKHCLDKKILLLTYNARLKIETREKIEKLKITNMEAHSYHAFLCRYYKAGTNNDKKIKTALKCEKPKIPLTFDLVIVDEAQDITPLLYEVICKMVSDNDKYPQFCIVGDEQQTIYDYHTGQSRADSRYLTFAEQTFSVDERKWQRCQLLTSYRLTTETADFINKCMIRTKRIQTLADKKGIKPEYMIMNPYHGYKIVSLIKSYLTMGYKNEDIFILSGSVNIRSRTPLRGITNMLEKEGIHIYITSREKSDDAEMYRGKIVISTFHKAKGLERKIVFVLNFDNSFFTYGCGRDTENDLICHNYLYVACTRAKEKLIMIHGEKEKYLPFLNIKKLPTRAVTTGKLIKDEEKRKPRENNKIGVTELLRHLSIDVIEHAMTYLKTKTIKKSSKEILDRSDHILSYKKYSYDVSAINGTCIPALYEYQKNEHLTIYDMICSKELKKQTRDQIILYHLDKLKTSKKIRKRVKGGAATFEDIAKTAMVFEAICHGFNFSLNQIKSYDWLSERKIKKLMKRLSHISDKAIYEFPVNIKGIFEKDLCGYIDCIDENILWEFKLVSEISDEHILQTAIYKYLYQFKKDITTKIYNINTKETIEITASQEQLMEMIKYIIHAKYSKKERLTFEEFINGCNIIRDRQEICCI
jgi:hypothetical protein|uniref:UvrD-like helicase C-terminal domain-containing protein n=1 Tax=viral metagenome TaxID=1070528 RepID=A0A6C0IYN5_9ZZZZ